jgi:outer membrane protein assembly factor BamB
VILDGDGNVRWRNRVSQDVCYIHAIGNPAILDYDSDGTPEVLAPTTERYVYAYAPFTGRMELRQQLTSFGYSKPVVVSGQPRTVIVADFNGTVFSIYPNGTTAWIRRVGGVFADPAVADFDDDNRSEIAVGSVGNVTLFEANGSMIWQTDAAATWMAAGQLDRRSVIVAAGNRQVVALAGDTGTVLWRWRPTAVPTLHQIGDGDGDGTMEVYVATNAGRVYALNARTGTVEWRTTLTTAQMNMMPPPTLGDLDGDETLELVAVTNTGLVSVIDPKSGEILASYRREVAIWTFPTVADIDGDTQEEILVMYGDGRVVALSYSETGAFLPSVTGSLYAAISR